MTGKRKHFIAMVMVVLIALLSFSSFCFAEYDGYTTEDIWVRVNAPDGGVNLRYGPGTEYDKINYYMIPNGTDLYIYGSAWSSNGKLWGETDYEGDHGWVFLEQCELDYTELYSDPGDYGIDYSETTQNTATPSTPDVNTEQPQTDNYELPDEYLEQQMTTGGSGMSIGLIAGIAIGAVIVILLIILLIVLLTRKKTPAAPVQNNPYNNQMNAGPNMGMPNQNMNPNMGMNQNMNPNMGMPNQNMNPNMGQNAGMPNNGMQNSAPMNNGQNNGPFNGNMQ